MKAESQPESVSDNVDAVVAEEESAAAPVTAEKVEEPIIAEVVEVVKSSEPAPVDAKTEQVKEAK